MNVLFAFPFFQRRQYGTYQTALSKFSSKWKVNCKNNGVNILFHPFRNVDNISLGTMTSTSLQFKIIFKNKFSFRNNKYEFCISNSEWIWNNIVSITYFIIWLTLSNSIQIMCLAHQEYSPKITQLDWSFIKHETKSYNRRISMQEYQNS